MTPIFAIITGPEIAILVGIAVLLFGAERIPKLARSMGEAKKEFEAAQRGPRPGEPPPPNQPANTSSTSTPSGAPPSTPPPAAPQV